MIDNNKPKEKLIGLFAIVSISMFIAIILMILGDRIFDDNDERIVMYFEESIKGLNVGSPVVFRGVEIGKVSKIELIYGELDDNFNIPVFVKFNKENTIREENLKEIENKLTILQTWIDRGLRARLSGRNLLTGQLSIELEILPETEAIYRSKRKNDKLIEIPTVVSPIGALSKGLQDLPIRQALRSINVLLEAINKDMPSILDNTSAITKTINRSFNSDVGKMAITINNLNKTLNDISETAKSIKSFTDYLERHPEALLKGKKEEKETYHGKEISNLHFLYLQGFEERTSQSS